MLAANINVNIILVFFIYGLAFFSMGLVMLLEAGRSPLIVETKVLYLLSLFGFVHGIHEWLEVVVEHADLFGLRVGPQYGLLRLGLLAVSFTPLILFGLRVLIPQRKFSHREIALGVSGLGLLLAWLVLVTLFTRSAQDDWVRHTDALIRYALAVPGALLAGLALEQQGKVARLAGRPRLQQYLRWAGIWFVIYGLTQFFVPSANFFPANRVNAAAFTQAVGLPIQVFRAALAVAATVSLLRATQEAEGERQRQFVEIQQARLAAMEQVQSDILERETLRRELLRHTVVAQEEERARIARELHDETAQVLTAFSLNLAAMQDQLPNDAQVRKMILRLQALCRQMSQGIYRLVHDLRPAQLDDLGLVAALNYLADEERKRAGFEVDLSVQGKRERLEPLVETVLFRVAQEALQNVIRHAQVKKASLELRFTPEKIALTISDQGVGFDTGSELIPPQGWGLAGMRERAESLDGELLIESRPGGGTAVRVVIPLQSKNPPALAETE